VRDGTASDDRRAGVAPAAAVQNDRGQTTLDFAVGMGLFIISLIFILVFVPGLLDPFTAGTQDETPAVNRVADQLSQQLLGTSTEPYVVSTHCTLELFEDDAVEGCPFSGSTLNERLGVRDLSSVNVTIRSNVTGSAASSVLCWDTDTDPASLSEGSSCDTRLASGPSPVTTSSKTVSARRVVVLNGHDVTIHVEMW